MTALHLAAVNNSIDVAKLLLKIPNIEMNGKDDVSILNYLYINTLYIIIIIIALIRMIVYDLVHFCIWTKYIVYEGL